jgi:signal transduction histidine kinase
MECLKTPEVENMIRDIFEISSSLLLKCQNNSLNEFFLDTFIIADDNAQKNLVKLTLQVSDYPIFFTFDYYFLQQALLKLIDNAVEASPTDGEVVVCGRYERDKLVIEVTDWGGGTICGLAAEISITRGKKNYDDCNLSQLITKLSDGGNVRLLIAQQIIEAHNGMLIYERQGLQSTTLRITLPPAEF